MGSGSKESLRRVRRWSGLHPVSFGGHRVPVAVSCEPSMWALTAGSHAAAVWAPGGSPAPPCSADAIARMPGVF